MKLVTTVGEILGAAQKDETPKVRYSFDRNGATCLFGGIIRIFGLGLPEEGRIRDNILDGFVELDGVMINPQLIQDAEIREYATARSNGLMHVGSLAMALNDFQDVDFDKKRIASALLDAMTPAQIEHLIEIEYSL